VRSIPWLVLPFAAVGAWGYAPRAAAAVVYSDPADALMASDGSIIDVPVGPIGASTNEPGAGAYSAVFVFQLPSRPNGGLTRVSSAHLQFTIEEDRPDGAYAIDLYGLPARQAPDVDFGDEFHGPWNSRARKPTDTLIGTGVIPIHTTRTGPVDTDANIDAALVNYLNDQYGPTGSYAGWYVFLRLNPDMSPDPEDTGVDIAFADNLTDVPQLTVEFAPEPASAAGVLVAGGVACARRRRQ
jgi:hypothetical protein